MSFHVKKQRMAIAIAASDTITHTATLKLAGERNSTAAAKAAAAISVMTRAKMHAFEYSRSGSAREVTGRALDAARTCALDLSIAKAQGCFSGVPLGLSNRSKRYWP
jgi:hypothetical protein